MNPKQIRSTQSTAASQESSAPASAGQSDTKEILFLAAGLITLVLGIGGVLMYSEGKEVPVTTASQDHEVKTFPITTVSASSSPSSSSFPSPTVVDDFPSLSSSAPFEPTASTSDESQQIDPTDVHFDFNRWALTDTAKALIKTQVEALPEEWHGTFLIQGHTDAQGPDTYNKTLGLKRAQAVKTYLVSLGMAKDTVQIETMGKAGAVCEEKTPTCFERNRRAHLAFLLPAGTQDHAAQLAQVPPILNSLSEAEPLPVFQDLGSLDSAIASSIPEDTSVELVTAEPLMAAETRP